MRLREFRVRGFRCIRDSGVVPVQDVAALIGKNESGKTALLEALTYLNKDRPIRDLDLCDEMTDEVSKPDFRVVAGVFELAPSETEAITTACRGAPRLQAVTIFRTVQAQQAQYEFGDAAFDVRHEVNPNAEPAFLPAINATAEILQSLEATEKAKVGEKSTSNDNVQSAQAALDKLRELATLTPEQTDQYLDLVRQGTTRRFPEDSALASHIKELEQARTFLFTEISIQNEVREFISRRLHPRLVYFPDYKKIYGAINIPQYLAGPQSLVSEKLDSGEVLDRIETIDNLFYLAGLDPQRLEQVKAQPAQRNKYLGECSRRLTTALESTWLTQRIEVELEYSNDILVVKISDLHRDGSRTNTGLLQRRSEGFRWHFSFFVNFKAETKKADLKEAILLLDDPGVHLHPAQQAGLLSVIKDLAATNQVIYSTHSPFMIFNFEIGNLLTVELDPSTHLSSIRSTYWDSDLETLIPILHALGGRAITVPISRFTSGSRHNVIVEGPTDYMFLETMGSVIVNASETSHINIARIQFVPANGSAAIAPLALFSKNKGRDVAALYDNEPDARKQAEVLKKYGFEPARVVFVTCDNKPEADIEDLFTEREYLTAVNQVYREILKDARYVQVTGDTIKQTRERDASLIRIVPTLEAIWAEHAADNWGTFDKRKVCERLCANMTDPTHPPSTNVIERFQALFQSLHQAFRETPQADPANEP